MQYKDINKEFFPNNYLIQLRLVAGGRNKFLPPNLPSNLRTNYWTRESIAQGKHLTSTCSTVMQQMLTTKEAIWILQVSQLFRELAIGTLQEN